MATKKKIAVMTSGGDSPGMNGVVRAVVRMAIHLGCDAYCVYDGYEGLVQGGDSIRKAEWRDVRNWLSQGGTLIGTQRCMAFFERKGRLTAAKNMILSGIDAIIICGGDVTAPTIGMEPLSGPTNVRVDDALLDSSQRMKIGFINVGAPAGGMNAAVRAGVAYCISRGHEPIAIHNGFAGFTRHHDDQPVGSVRPFDWLEVDAWASRGGSEIGTNRELPEESGMELVANLIEQYQFDALFLIGGFEAFHAVAQLRKARDQYPSLCIPMCLLPATISNNVPGSEYSLGSDTCLNELVNYCDKIKQSASATRRRVFVVETQGGKSGYIATLAGLSVGASAVYTPEEGLDLETLASDVRHLREVFAHDRGMTSSGRLILVNEKADSVFNAKLIADIIRKEARGRFESRDSIPGHVQQGGVPSPMDRCRAVRLAIKCMQHLEEFRPKSHNRCKKDPMSASVIGIKGAQVTFTPMQELEEQDTDWKNRRPKATHWAHMKNVVDILGGRPQHTQGEQPLEGLVAKDVKRGLAYA
ncbi:hypothetical protein BN1708_013868 [Verticillium longisporum]|uniref:6-phosphofructokinase n=1 Tax=Verticillium longisporum TaxID=100787 RepID=A0A0G4LQ31_VERLO|nr:hypothetical protein BN1708_013868 [Verticillium longisporum]